LVLLDIPIRNGGDVESIAIELTPLKAPCGSCVWTPHAHMALAAFFTFRMY
jgi:hypothetical protein